MTSILNVNNTPQSIEQAIQEAIAQAREACEQEGGTSSSCAVAWDIVEELQAERSHRIQAKTAFERYCDENPSADECRIYDV
jgi:hypothetical protein